MGFESSQVARRRLAALAASNGRVQEALSPASFPGAFSGPLPTYGNSHGSVTTVQGHEVARTSASPNSGALALHLDDLAQEIVSVPGAGGALLAAFAAQARALSMVIEAARRSGNAPIPASVILAAQEALASPPPLPGLVIG